MPRLFRDDIRIIFRSQEEALGLSNLVSRAQAVPNVLDSVKGAVLTDTLHCASRLADYLGCERMSFRDFEYIWDFRNSISVRIGTYIAL
jgi:hypothetical protein